MLARISRLLLATVLLVLAAKRVLHGSRVSRPGPLPAKISGQFTAAMVIAVLLGLSALVLVAGYGIRGLQAAHRQDSVARQLTGGTSHRAPELMIANGCSGCHRIPGVPGAVGTVGPELKGLVSRPYIGGVLTNAPNNLVQWIRQARSINPRTAMPNTNVSDQDARDIAAYLYSAGSQ